MRLSTHDSFHCISYNGHLPKRETFCSLLSVSLVPMMPQLFRKSWLQSLKFFPHGILNVSFGKTQSIFHVRILQNAEENLTVNVVISKETKYCLNKELNSIQICVIVACKLLLYYWLSLRVVQGPHPQPAVLVSLRLCRPIRMVLSGSRPSLLCRGLFVI